MRVHSKRYLFLFGLALLLAASLNLSALPARAAAPSIGVIAAQTSVCDKTKRVERAIPQNGSLDLTIRGFLDSEDFDLTLTFPDGRRYRPDAAERMPGAADALDGLSDIIPDPLALHTADSAGELFLSFASNQLWPPGCYSISANGAVSFASVRFIVLESPLVSNPGPAQLTVLDTLSGQPQGEQGVTVSVSGTGFRGNEHIELTIVQPNKTLIMPQTAVTSANGSFQTSIVFDTLHRSGLYTFIARGVDSSYQVSGRFLLKPATLAPTGIATLRVSGPFPAVVRQGQDFQIIGNQFVDGSAAILFVAPNGIIYGGGTFANITNGTFAQGSVLDRQHPPGLYKIIVIDSGPNLAATSLRLLAQP